MNAPGSTSVPSGFSPAHQDFGAAQLAGADIDDRLVVGHEFAGLERAFDLGHRIAGRAPRHQHGEHAQDHDDGAGGEQAEPLQLRVAGNHVAARHRYFGVETEFFGFRLGHESGVAGIGALADIADHGAIGGGDVRIGAERAALGGHLRQEQNGRHQRRNFIGAGADLAAQPHHGLAVLELDDVERIPVGADQRLGGDQLALAERQAEIGAQRLPVGTDDGDFLDRHGVEGGLPHRLDVVRPAAIHAARRQTVERGDHLRDAGFGERDGALGGGVDFLLALPIDQAAEPEIERKQGSAGEQHADDDRNDILARECAHNQTHPGARLAPHPGALSVSHGAVKGGLSLRRGASIKRANGAHAAAHG